MRKVLLTGVAFTLGFTSLQADPIKEMGNYLLNGKSVIGNTGIKKHTKHIIDSEQKLSKVLLSFEQEYQVREQMVKMAKEQEKQAKEEEKAREEKERREKKREEDLAKKKKGQNSFPSLQEQMQQYGFRDENSVEPGMGGGMSIGGLDANGNPIIAMPQKQLKQVYGIFCSAGRCYGIGENEILKVGDDMGISKIKKITQNYIMLENGEKLWFTR